LNAKAGLDTEWKYANEGSTVSNALGDMSLLGLDCDDNASARLIVGVDATEQRVNELNEKISVEGGNVTDTISADGIVRALTVEVPYKMAFLFSQKIRTDELVKYVVPDSKVKASAIPNDPYWSLQWSPKIIEADAAWDTTVGSSDVLVAIIDTGIEYTHSDLAANYVPLGYDWVNDDNDPMDDAGHGTHCAGIVAATLNNNIGIAGVAQVRIMAEKVLTSAGWGYHSWIIQGIYDAVAKGAKIISMSLGGSSSTELFREVVKYAHDHGVLVIAAVGNEHSNAPHYPAAYDGVVAVAATDSSDNVAGFSNFGNWIDLAAPGVDVYSTFLGNSYEYLSGTSMACPHVTGVAALAWGVFSNYTADQITEVLERTADDLGEPGYDEYYGHGRVNARRAVAGIPIHDVSITGWKQAHRLDPGHVDEFNVTVSNYGRSNETNVSVQFFINVTLIDTKTISSLEVGAFASLNFSWGTTTEGIYNVTCYVVPVPGETVIENNVAHAKVAVRFVAILKVPTDYSTVKAAVNDAYDGDTVLVSEGYYAEGEIDIFKDNITLIADGYVTLDGCAENHVLNILANYVVVNRFDIRNASFYGVNVRGYGNVIARSTILRNGNGVRLYSCDNCVLSHNLVSSGGDGIDVEYSSNNIITLNRLVSGAFFGGLNLFESSNNTITENTLSGGILCGAILLYLSENNLIASNIIKNNRCGLALVGSPNNVLRNNVMTNNWCGFSAWRGIGPAPEYAWVGPSDVDTSNTVDGKPIYYWVDVSDRVVPSDARCLVLVNCKNITVENLDIKNNYNGILIVNSSSILIRHNNITHNRANYDYLSSGILTLGDSYNITVTRNNIIANSNGLFLWGHDNTVSQNDVSNNAQNGMSVLGDNCVVTQNNMTGNQGVAISIGSNCFVSSNNIVANLNVAIFVQGSNDTIVSNNIVGSAKPFEEIYLCSHEGIMLYFASNCTVRANNIIDKSDYGISIYSCSNNMILHNNFINNLKQFYLYESANFWDNGYPSGGNYWSDYKGSDEFNGPNQNLPGADGIGDTPQLLDANNTDHYPLMTPCLENPPLQTCSLTITGVIGGSQIKGFYDTPYPRPGTYLFIANSTIRVDTQLYYNTFVDHWELDGVNVGSNDYIVISMNKNHALKAVLSLVPPLEVSINPTTANIDPGESVTFTSSVAGGKAPYEYQWKLNGKEVLDGTDSSWTFTPKKYGTYYISLGVSYPFSTPPYSTPTTSDNSVITVGPLFNVYISPTSVGVFVGETVDFVSSVSSEYLPYSYQWYLNDKLVSGAEASTWNFTANTVGKYSVCLEVTDDIGIIVKSNVATVAVSHPLIVYIYPSSAEILTNESVDFSSIVLWGFAPYSYQWYLDGSPVSGATSSKWTFEPPESGNFTIFFKVTDSFGFTNESKTASVNAKEPLAVSISPTLAQLQIGETIQFKSVTSGGDPPYEYQWYLNDSPVVNATSSTWTFKPALPGTYYVKLVVTDNVGNTKQSEIAQVEAIHSIPVGGYSLQQVKAKAEPVTPSLILLTILTAVIIIKVKRKAKKQF
jgi:parallel beta-helix repeat protein